MTFGEELNESWEEDYVSPPIAHMEEYTLTRLSEDYPGVTAEELLRALNDSSIKVTGMNLTLKDIAAQNEITPSRIYDVVNSRYSQKAVRDASLAPSGVGKMTLDQVAATLECKTEELIKFIKENNLNATGSTTMRSLSDQLGISPHDLNTMLYTGITKK
jgi:hypothetical protein